ncbi:hypothetical protein AC578_1345 [Pseudocercospora eumusae]|uniref:Heterokaryon incompatibility domain-containing protein n=1 Tax=Pseudocercospora eumusae TaxID=321146 RepID=A0A139HUF4_9PEZI|nr:hypothetical protein AC578_1345 [Pseudocercospora eumusae]
MPRTALLLPHAKSSPDKNRQTLLPKLLPDSTALRKPAFDLPPRPRRTIVYADVEICVTTVYAQMLEMHGCAAMLACTARLSWSPAFHSCALILDLQSCPFRRGKFLMAITAHSFAGLMRIRQAAIEELKIMRWIDAICINEADTEERSHQVRMMAQIYSRAEMTIVRLGEEDYNGQFEVLSNICNVQRAQNSFNPKELNLNLTSSHEWGLLKALFRRKWFYRQWTVQEYLLSTHITLLVESNWMPVSNVVSTSWPAEFPIPEVFEELRATTTIT